MTHLHGKRRGGSGDSLLGMTSMREGKEWYINNSDQ